MKQSNILLILTIIFLSTACGQTNRKIQSKKNNIDLQTIDNIYIYNNTELSDTISEIKKSLSEKQIAEFVNKWNNAEPNGICKYLPNFWIEIKLNNGNVRKFRANGLNIKENNDYCFNIGNPEFIKNLWITSKKMPNDILKTGWYYINQNEKGIKRKLENTNEFIYLNPKPIVTANDFKTIEIYNDNKGNYGLIIKLNEYGTKEWSIATGKTIGRKLAFVFKNNLIYTPMVNAQINSGITALNRGDLNELELKEIKKEIENGK